MSTFIAVIVGLDQLVNEIIAGLIIITPLAVAVIVTWLQVQRNTKILSNTPNYDELHQAIENKVNDLMVNGVSNGETKSVQPRSSTGTSGAGAGADSV